MYVFTNVRKEMSYPKRTPPLARMGASTLALPHDEKKEGEGQVTPTTESMSDQSSVQALLGAVRWGSMPSNSSTNISINKSTTMSEFGCTNKSTNNE